MAYYIQCKPNLQPKRVPPESAPHYDKPNEIDRPCNQFTWQIERADGVTIQGSAVLSGGKTNCCYVIQAGDLCWGTPDPNLHIYDMGDTDCEVTNAWISDLSADGQTWTEYNQIQGVVSSLYGMVITTNPDLGTEGTLTVNVPIFERYNDGITYTNTGTWENAINIVPDSLYANWVCGYTNSNDTVYSLAVSCPLFYDSESDYYGKNEIAKVLLNIYYTIAGETISIYSNTYNYGETWTGKLSDIIGQSQMDLATKIAVGVASILDIDDIIMKFYVYYPADDEPVRTAQGYIDFDHNNVESYGFAEPPAGDTITFKSGVVLDDSDSDIDNPDPEKEDSDDLTDPTISDITGTGLLTKTYVLTPQEVQGIGQFLWGATFMENIRLLNTSPIENVVSCKLFPFDMTGTPENVHIGNVDSGTAGQKVAQNVIKKTSNAIKVTPYYGEKADNLHFLDYDPYTKVEIFLPFIGIKELPTDIVMNKHIKIEWYIDLVCGTLETDVMVEYKKDGNGNPVYNCFYILSSQCGVDIPLTAQNLAQVQSAYIQNAIGGGVSLATGNVAGVVQSIAGAVTTQYHTQTTGTPSPSTALQAQLDPYLRITRPVAKFVGQKSKKGVTPITPDDPANKNRTYFYKHLVGAPLYQVKNLGSLQGYTEVENPQIAIDGALSVEVEEIERLLESGVILEMPDILGA